MCPQKMAWSLRSVVPTLMKLARRVLDTAYQLRGDALLTDLDAQFAALIDTDAVCRTSS